MQSVCKNSTGGGPVFLKNRTLVGGMYQIPVFDRSWILPLFHSTCPLWRFTRRNSGISPKRHTICVDQSVSYLKLYNIKSGRFGLNLHFAVWNTKITTSASFPYLAHAHGSWWPCNRWGSCSWGQCEERTHGWHQVMHSDSTDLGESEVDKRGTIFWFLN